MMISFGLCIVVALQLVLAAPNSLMVKRNNGNGNGRWNGNGNGNGRWKNTHGWEGDLNWVRDGFPNSPVTQPATPPVKQVVTQPVTPQVKQATQPATPQVKQVVTPVQLVNQPATQRATPVQLLNQKATEPVKPAEVGPLPRPPVADEVSAFDEVVDSKKVSPKPFAKNELPKQESKTINQLADSLEEKQASKEIGPVDIAAQGLQGKHPVPDSAQGDQQTNAPESAISESGSTPFNTGLIVGIVLGLVCLGSATIIGIFWMRSKHKKDDLGLDKAESTEQTLQENVETDSAMETLKSDDFLITID